MGFVLLFVALLLFVPHVHAECTVNEPDNTVCEAETVVESDGELAEFQPPSINDNDQVGVIALTNPPQSFLYRGTVYSAGAPPIEAFSRTDTTQGSFFNIRVSTLSRLPTFPLSNQGDLFGPLDVYDEFGAGVLAMGRGGAGGFSTIADPLSFPAGRFINVRSDTPIVVNPNGTFAYSAEMRSSAGAVIEGEGIFRGSTGTEVVVQTSMAAPDAGETYLGFLSPVVADKLAINTLDQLAFTALVSGNGIDTSNDERLIRETATGFQTIAREGDSAPQSDASLGAIYANVSNHTFGNVSYNTRGDVAFSARLQETFVPLDYLTGGQNGAGDYDGIFTVTAAGDERALMIRGDTPSLYFDETRLVTNGSSVSYISGFSAPQLNNSGQIAFFAHVGGNTLRDGQGLFSYDIDTDEFTRIFQTSGQTSEQMLMNADGVDGLTFFNSGNYPNELAINDRGTVAFTAEVIAGLNAPTREGLFIYDAGQLSTLALVGASIDTNTGTKTISRIEFLSGSTSSGRPAGLSNSSTAAFGLIFDDASSGVFTSRQQILVVQDFLWNGDCGSSDWHDTCAGGSSSNNWLDRVSRDAANRLPGSEAFDRVFVENADVVISAEPVSIFSIMATGSLDVRRPLALEGLSNIEDLILDAQLSITNELALSGSNSRWLSGDIRGNGPLVITPNAAATGRLVAELTGIATLATPLEVSDLGDFSINSGNVQIGDNGFVLVNAGGNLGFAGGVLSQVTTHPQDFAVINNGNLTKAGAGNALISADYQHGGGPAQISGGNLTFSGQSNFLGGTFTVAPGARLTFADAGNFVLLQGVDIQSGGTVALDGTLATFSGTRVELIGDGALELGPNLEVAGDALNISGGRTVNTGSARFAESNLRVTTVEVASGELTLVEGEIDSTDIEISDEATLSLTDGGLQILGEVNISGTGTLSLADGVRLTDNGLEGNELNIDAPSVIESATFQGAVLGPAIPIGINSSLTVRNTSDMRVESTLRLDSSVLFNGRAPRELANEAEATGTFTTLNTARIDLINDSDLINIAGSTMTLNGRLSTNAAGPRALNILNSGDLSLNLELQPDQANIVLYNNVNAHADLGSVSRAEQISIINNGQLLINDPFVISGEALAFAEVSNLAPGRITISHAVQGITLENAGEITLQDGGVLQGFVLTGQSPNALLSITAATGLSDGLIEGELDIRITANTAFNDVQINAAGVLEIDADVTVDLSSDLTPDEVVVMPDASLQVSGVPNFIERVFEEFGLLPSVRLLAGEWTLNNASASASQSFSLNRINEISTGVEVSLSGEETFFFGLFDDSDRLWNYGTLSLENITRSIGPDSAPGRLLNSGTLVVGPGAALHVRSVNNRGFLRLNGGTVQVDESFSNNGSLDIGASPGTGTIDGDLLHSGVLSIELGGTRPGIDYDQLIVTGTTTITPGGIIEITLIDPDPTDAIDELFRPRTGDAFEFLLTGDLDIGGSDPASFITFANAPSGLRFNIDLLDANGLISLMLNAQFGIDSDVLAALSGNPAELGGYLNTLLLSDALNNDPRQAVISDLAALDTAAFSSVAGQLHPELYAGAPEVMAYQQNLALNRLFDNQMHARADRSTGVWLGALGARGELDGSQSRGTAGVDVDLGGAVLGGDLPLGQDGSAYIGAMIGKLSADQTLDGLRAHQEHDGVLYGVYGGYQSESFALRGYASYTNGDTDSRRSITLPGSMNRVYADYNTDSYSGYLQASFAPLFRNEHISLRPVAGLSYIQIERDAFTETGGPFALSVQGDQYEGLFTELGVALRGGTQRWQPQMQLGWRYNVNHTADRARARLADTQGASFTARGAVTPRSMAFMGLGVSAGIGSGRLFLQYEGSYATGFNEHAGQLGVYFPL